MAGHSKWANIKHKKAKQDSKRGKIFTKIGKEIMVAVKLGGPDPEGNSRLKMVLVKAKDNNLPNDNIKRLIQKAAGDDNNTNYEELVYEGYGTGGAAVIVDVLTDNRNRTAGEIRHIFDKYGGNMGETGCVSWMFDRKGLITLPLNDWDEEEITLIAIEAGADDVEVEEEGVLIYTTVEDFLDVKQALENQKIEIGSAELSKIPSNTIEITDVEQGKLLVKLMDMLDDNDDVQNTYSNFDFSEDVLEAIS